MSKKTKQEIAAEWAREQSNPRTRWDHLPKIVSDIGRGIKKSARKVKKAIK